MTATNSRRGATARAVGAGAEEVFLLAGDVERVSEAQLGELRLEEQRAVRPRAQRLRPCRHQIEQPAHAAGPVEVEVCPLRPRKAPAQERAAVTA